MSDNNCIETVYGKVCRNKRRKQRRKAIVAEHLQDFARNTTLHGLRYVTERGITRLEKIFWLILFLVSVGICSYQIRNVWVKRNNTPVIVSISERLVPVSEVLFPSVTICPQWKVSTKDYEYGKQRFKILNFFETQLIPNLTLSEEIIKYEDVSLICETRLTSFNFNVSDRKYSDSEVVQNILKATYFTDDSMSQCTWRQNELFCLNMLKRVATKEGICYNFNAQAADEMFRGDQIQQNYSYIETNDELLNNTLIVTTIKRGQPNGSGPDLSINFIVDKTHIDEECNPFFSGYKVFLHHPLDMPHSSLYYYAIEPDKTTSLALKYTVMSTSDDLKYSYHPETRQCFYSEERRLRYFKTYTENNCRLECLSNYTYDQCGCVGFYMPYHRSDRICTRNSLECINEVLDKIAKPGASGTGQASGPCNCLPACDYVEYEAEVLKTEFNVKQYIHKTIQNYSDEYYTNLTFSRLEMYFKSPRYVAMRRTELFGWTDLIANCGGLLGLFMGFSFLSLVEIIYFITLRICCSFKRDLDKEENIEKNM